ncbi:hypothetical protein MVEN_00612700 [Mycena venus]|uniref:Uncharacterized protein n=1 Tax=Mycena venus TaxID=2733690 RepID=A0A8H7D7U1_9AGAR|nr:hypothetical protein MVEN_00612700 [Mycena venus]
MASILDLPHELIDRIVSEFQHDLVNLPPFFQFASYVRRLDMPIMDNFLPSAILPPATLAQLPNVTNLSAHSDPFDFRRLPTGQKSVLAEAASRLTSVEIITDYLWPLPAWAALLNGCPALATLVIKAEAAYLGSWTIPWTVADFAFPMPTPSAPGTLRLRTLRVSGDCKILVPLSAWLIPQGALATLQTLVLDVSYVRKDYSAPDARPALVLAAAPSLRELTLHLDPPMPLTSPDIAAPIRLTSFPRLRVLHLRDGPYADIGASLAWLGAFLQPPSSSPHAHMHPEVSALEALSLDHNMIRRDLLAVPVATWCAIEEALLGGEVDAGGRGKRYPHLRSVTFKVYQKFSFGVPDVFEYFSGTVRERLPRLVERGMLVAGR